jgi:hypothetical protein
MRNSVSSEHALPRRCTSAVAGEPWGFVRDRPGSVIWPWIGEQYEPGGVALLGLNYRNGDTEATVALEYLAASNDAEQLQQGHYKSKFGSDFPTARWRRQPPCSPASTTSGPPSSLLQAP